MMLRPEQKSVKWITDLVCMFHSARLLVPDTCVDNLATAKECLGLLEN